MSDVICCENRWIIWNHTRNHDSLKWSISYLSMQMIKNVSFSQVHVFTQLRNAYGTSTRWLLDNLQAKPKRLHTKHQLVAPKGLSGPFQALSCRPWILLYCHAHTDIIYRSVYLMCFFHKQLSTFQSILLQLTDFRHFAWKYWFRNVWSANRLRRLKSCDDAPAASSAGLLSQNARIAICWWGGNISS